MKTVYRQSLRNRIVHWGIALSCFGLIFTGILQMPVAKRYGLAALGEWTTDYFTTLPLHYACGIVFTALCVFHVLIHALEGNFDIVPKKGDFGRSVAVIKAMITGAEEPPSEKYLPEQRLAWAAFVAAFSLVIVTGWLKTLKNLAGWDLADPVLFWLAQLHNLGMVLTIVLFLGHMAAFAFKPNRALLPAMMNGTVDADYAAHRHSLWRPSDSSSTNGSNMK